MHKPFARSLVNVLAAGLSASNAARLRAYYVPRLIELGDTPYSEILSSPVVKRLKIMADFVKQGEQEAELIVEEFQYDMRCLSAALAVVATIGDLQAMQ